MKVPTKHEEKSMGGMGMGMGVGERDGLSGWSGDVVSEEGKGEQKMEVRRYARKKPPPMQRLIIHDRMEDSGCHSDSQGEGSGRRSSSSPRSNTSSPRHHRRHRSCDSDKMLEEKCSGREKNSRMSLQALIHLHRLEDSDRTDSNDEGVSSRRSSRRSHSSPRNHQNGDNNNSDIISRFLDDNITNSESDGSASSSRTPRHHRRHHHHSRSTHEDHSAHSRDHSCDRNLNESSPRSSRHSRGDRHRHHGSNRRHHHVDKSSSNEELADEVDDIIISEIEVQKTMQELFDVFINDKTKDTTEEMRAAAKYSILSLMKSSTNFEPFIDSFTLSLTNVLAVDYGNDTQISASLDLLELLVGPSKSFVFPPDNGDEEALFDNFLELLAPSLGKFFECVVGIFTHLHECPYEKKASALRILTHLITYSGKQASRILSCLQKHEVAVIVAEKLQNDTDEILMKYEMIANSDMLSADTFFDFACKVKHYNALYRLFGTFDTRLRKILLNSHNNERPPSVAVSDSGNEIEGESPTNSNKQNFISCYEESKTQFLYILSTMANSLGLYTDSTMSTALNNILRQLLEGAQHGHFLDRIEFLRVVCHLGGGESVFKTLILDSSIVETFTFFLKNCCTSYHARTIEVMWHLNVLCANVACRNVLFCSGLIPEIIEKMKVVGKRVSHLSNLKILLPFVSNVTEWDCSNYSELLSHLLDVIFDKSHDGRVRIVYKELFLVLAHGVGESVTMHKAFVTANCLSRIVNELRESKQKYITNINIKKKFAPGSRSSISTFLHYVLVLAAGSSAFRQQLTVNEAGGFSVLLELLEIVPPLSSSTFSVDEMDKLVYEIHGIKIATCRAIEFIVRDVSTLGTVLSSTRILSVLFEMLAPNQQQATISISSIESKRAALEILYILSATTESCQVLCQANLKCKLQQFKLDENLEDNCKVDNVFNKLTRQPSHIAEAVFDHPNSAGDMGESRISVGCISNLKLVNSLILRCNGGKWLDKIVEKLAPTLYVHSTPEKLDK